jgi:hypothetical protein
MTTGTWQVAANRINGLTPEGRYLLAARVRAEASKDDGLTTNDLDYMQERIENGEADWALAHYIVNLTARPGGRTP